MNKVAVLIALFAGLIVIGCGPSAAVGGGSVEAAGGGTMAPAMVLEDAQGNEVSLEALRGKVVLVNFWATWCGPCRVEMPWFVEFQRKYKDQGFSVVAVSMDEEGWEVVRPWIEELEPSPNFPVVVGTEALAEEFGGVEALPTTFLIDREGQVAASHMGLVSKGSLEGEIEGLL